MINLFWIVSKEEYINANDIESGYYEYEVEFRKRGVNFRFLDIHSCFYLINADKKLSFHEYDHKLSLNDDVYILSPSNINPQARSIFYSIRNMMNATDKRLLNGRLYGIDLLEWDKAAQLVTMLKLGVPVLPFSSVGYGKYAEKTVVDFIQITGKDKLIFKPNSSGMGFGVIKANDKEHAIAISNLVSTASINYIVMPFLSEVSDYRFYFINGIIKFIKIRTPQSGNYLGNVALGAKQEVLTETEYEERYKNQSMYNELLAITKKVASELNSDIFSIDWLVDKETFYFNETCTIETGLTKLPPLIKEDVFDSISEIIKNRT